jgi:hypothetical protein
MQLDWLSTALERCDRQQLFIDFNKSQPNLVLYTLQPIFQYFSILLQECITQNNQTFHNVVTTTLTKRSSSAVGDHATCMTPTSPLSDTLSSSPGNTNNPVNTSLESHTIADNWTTEQDNLLQEGLKKFPNNMNNNEHWTYIEKKHHKELGVTD